MLPRDSAAVLNPTIPRPSYQRPVGFKWPTQAGTLVEIVVGRARCQVCKIACWCRSKAKIGAFTCVPSSSLHAQLEEMPRITIASERIEIRKLIGAHSRRCGRDLRMRSGRKRDPVRVDDAPSVPHAAVEVHLLDFQEISRANERTATLIVLAGDCETFGLGASWSVDEVPGQLT